MDSDDGWCFGHSCLATVYFSSQVTVHLLHHHHCVNTSRFYTGCTDGYPYTDDDVEVEGHLFHVFHGCCENGDYCNDDISKLKLPPRYYDVRGDPPSPAPNVAPSSSSSSTHGILPTTTVVQSLSTTTSTPSSPVKQTPTQPNTQPSGPTEEPTGWCCCYHSY